MVPAARRERFSVQPHASRRPALHGAYAGERKVLELWRDAPARGEQQFVILTAVERLFECGAGKARWRLDARDDVRSQAQAVQVEREPVAQVHGGSGAPAQETSQREPRLGVAVALPCPAPARGEA